MGPYGHNPSIDEITAQYQRASTLISLIEKNKTRCKYHGITFIH